jgi:hypothetical protein
MRPPGVLAKDMPGTMTWGHSGKCKPCVQPNGPGDRSDAIKAEKPVAAAEPAAEAENVTVTGVRLQNTISSAGVEGQ